MACEIPASILPSTSISYSRKVLNMNRPILMVSAIKTIIERASNLRKIGAVKMDKIPQTNRVTPCRMAICFLLIYRSS